MIENNRISSSSITSKAADEVQLSEKKARVGETQQTIHKNLDRVEVSENARVMAKATAALNESVEAEDSEIKRITDEVQNGIYEIPLNKLASVLLDRLFKPD